MLKNKNNKKGFTLIELLIVVSVIGVLAGVTVSIINPTRTKNTAEDAVRQSNIERLVQGIEAYYAAEGSYPSDTDSDGNPLNTGSGNENVLSVYLNQWPTSSNYFYNGTFTYENGDPVACLSVSMATNSSSYFKYLSKFPVPKMFPQYKSCWGVVMHDCSTSCAQYNATNCVTENLICNYN